MPPDSELSEAPELPEILSKHTQWSIPKSIGIIKQWEAEMERLNAKYNLDCFSEYELYSESDEGEQYKHEHGYETLI